MVTLFYQTAIDHVYFYEIEFAKLIIRYHYWKDGSKVGRKYCAFQIKSEEKNLICMVVLKERKNNLLSKDIVEAIKKIEKKLDDSWKERKEIELC